PPPLLRRSVSSRSREHFPPLCPPQPLSHPCYVVFDGLGGNEQAITDLFVGQSGQHKTRHFLFTLTELALAQRGGRGLGVAPRGGIGRGRRIPRIDGPSLEQASAVQQPHHG